MSRPYMSTHYTSTQNVCMCVYVNTLQESMWLSVYVKTLYVNTLPQNMWVCGRYRDSARLLGESCWQKKLRGRSGKKLHENREIARGGEVEAEGTWKRAQIGAVLKPNTNAERMRLLSHLLRSPWYSLQIVEACRAVSNRESRYPRCVFMSTHCKKACGCLFMSTHYTSAHCKQKCGCLFVSTHFQVQRHCVCLQCVVVPCIPRCITLYHLVSRWHQHITTQTHTAHVPNLNTLQRTAPSYSKAHLSNLKSHTLLANKHLPNPQAQQALQLSAAGPTYWYECPPSFLCHVTYSQRRKELINYMWVSGRVAANAARPACRCTR